MKKRRTWILVAFLANLALMPLALAVPEGSAQQRSARVIYHCCKKTTTGRPYCCNRCCVFRWNCLDHEICEKRAQK